MYTDLSWWHIGRKFAGFSEHKFQQVHVQIFVQHPMKAIHDKGVMST
jgi:hypothetical protein